MMPVKFTVDDAAFCNLENRILGKGITNTTKFGRASVLEDSSLNFGFGHDGCGFFVVLLVVGHVITITHIPSMSTWISKFMQKPLDDRM